MNTCLICNINLGDSNPRQLCGKTYCMYMDMYKYTSDLLDIEAQTPLTPINDMIDLTQDDMSDSVVIDLTQDDNSVPITYIDNAAYCRCCGIFTGYNNLNPFCGSNECVKGINTTPVINNERAHIVYLDHATYCCCCGVFTGYNNLNPFCEKCKQ